MVVAGVLSCSQCFLDSVKSRAILSRLEALFLDKREKECA